MRVHRSYFSDRKAFTETPAMATGTLDVPVTGCGPQWSVVGPLLWDVTYNSVLTTALPLGAEVIGFADNTLIVANGKSTAEVERIVNSALGVVSAKIVGLGLLNVVEKSQAVLFTNRYKYTLPRLTINNPALAFTNDIQYLGIVMDRRLSFREHVRWQRTRQRASSSSCRK
uniref:Retrovirus-related Pol polyprotein from type-1 retrotransposable element R1 2 n=1 Tax=Schizaphis graminum TaxID=13262 RepID=A0A2S2NVM5_SCHGA